MRTIPTILLIFVSFSVFAQPQLPGGLGAFVERNLSYPSYSFRNCIEGVVKVAFKLTSTGKVYQSSVQSGTGTDLDDEALRLIRKTSGKWKVEAGYDTSTVVVAPVNFKLQGADCDRRSKAEIISAIAAYQSQQALTDAILNFYKKKGTEKDYTAEEVRINQLKKDLGYDEAYMKERVEAGEKKWKEGDAQGACEEFMFVKNMGFNLADDLIKKYCRPGEQSSE